MNSGHLRQMRQYHSGSELYQYGPFGEVIRATDPRKRGQPVVVYEAVR